MIVGNDISSAQGNIDWNTFKDNTNFVIMKATEGVGYIDSWFGNNRNQARLANLPRGFYHFARPDLGNSPQAEADYFCSLIDGQPIQVGEILCLDMEVTYNDTVNWCWQWLNAVSAHFGGMKPLIYLNQSLAGLDWSSVVDAGYGLWLASYTYDPNKNTGKTGKWPSIAIQQWTDSQQVPGISGNVDGDCFFGDTVAFKKYGFQLPVVTPPTTVQTNPNPPTTTTTTNPPQTPVVVQPVASSVPPTEPVEPTIVVLKPIIKSNWLLTLINWFKSLWMNKAK